MAIRPHLYTPLATFTFTEKVPFVADQGKLWNIDAPSIGTQTSAALTLEGAPSIAPYIEHDGTMYMSQAEGICLSPYYDYDDTTKGSTFTDDAEWTQISDSSQWDMIRWTLKEAGDGTAWSKLISKTIPGSSSINASFCVTFRHYKAPSSSAPGTAAEFIMYIGQTTTKPLALWWKEGINYIKVIDMSNGDITTDFDNVKAVNTISILGSKNTSIFKEAVISLTVLFVGNHMLIGNGLPDDKGTFYGETIIKGQPKVDSDNNVVVPTAKQPSSKGQANHFPAEGDGTYGTGTGISLKYDVGTIQIAVKGAQFDLAWVPVAFPLLGSFFCYNTSIPSDLVDDSTHVQRYYQTNININEVVDTIDIDNNAYSAELSPATSEDAVATPVWYKIYGYTEPTVIALPTTINIANQFIYSISGVEYSDRKEYTIVMRNREGQWKDLNGCYPVTLSFGWQYAADSSTETLHLTGYVTKISYQRDSKRSTVTLTLTDKRIVMQDAWACNLPIYDGWYDTDVIKDLCKRSGIAKMDLGRIELEPADLLNPLAERPVLADTVFNVDKMRLSIGSFKDVIWMFTEGLPLWDCALRVSTYTGCWLFFDSQGRLNYLFPGKEIPIRMVKAVNPMYQFKEVQTVGNFNEIKRLSLDKDFSNTYNRILIEGATPFYSKDFNIIYRMIPEDLESFTRNMHDSMKEGFIPWNKTKVFREPYYNTIQAVQRIADQYYRRLKRPFNTVSWDTWGQPQLFPLDIVRVYEQFPSGSQSVGTEHDDKFYIISSISHQLDAQNKSYTSTINADLLYPDWQYDFQLWEQ